MKNPNGYGSIINLGKQRRRPWAVRLTKGWKDGKQLYRYVGYYASKSEAIQALAKEHVQPTSEYCNYKFEDIYGLWSELHFPWVSEQSASGYKAAFKSLSSLHSMKFSDIRTNDIQKILDNLDKSASTKKKIKLLCNMMYNFACENDIVSKNYAQYLRIEREPHVKKDIFRIDEIETLFRNDDQGCADIILILIFTGLRIQELLNLKKADIDLKEMVITGGLKTDAGKGRTVPISEKILPYIKKYCDMTEDFLFTRKGKPLVQDYFRKQMYYPTLESLGIKRKTPHSTRHTCASMLTMAGANTAAIEQILGHTDYAFTADNYVTIDIDFLKENLSKI